MKEGEPGLVLVLPADSFNLIVTVAEIAEKHRTRSVSNLHGLGKCICSVSPADQVESEARAIFFEWGNRQAVCHHDKIYRFNFRSKWSNPTTLAGPQITDP